MEYTEEQKKEIRAEYAKRRSRQLKVSIPVVVLILLVVSLEKSGGAILTFVSISTLTWFIFALIIAVAIFSYKNWRCPACNQYLGKGIDKKFCDKCGVSLKE